mgnify:CR=1 FL=1
MKIKIRGKVVVLSLLFIFIMFTTGIIKAESITNGQELEQKNIKVRVNVLKGNIRLKAEKESISISEIGGGAILESKGKIGEWYKITLPPDKDGFVVSGYIHQRNVKVYGEDIEEPEKQKEIKLKKEKPVYTPPQPLQREQPVSEAEFSQKISAGFGFGSLYASFGVNVEFDPVEFLGIFGALGLGENYKADFFEFWKREKLAFAVGARFYPLSFLTESRFFFRPRVGLSYGYNGIYRGATYWGGYPQPNYKCLNGINVSFGSDFEILENLSVDLDVFIPITRSGYSYYHGHKISNLVENKNISLSFGIRYNFFLGL